MMFHVKAVAVAVAGLLVCTGLVVCGVSVAAAVEIDFSAPVLDLDGKAYRHCGKAGERGECADWVEHTLGLLSYTALDQPVEKSVNVLDQARRGMLARKIYSAGTSKVEVSKAEIGQIIDGLGALVLPPVEKLRVIEMLDPERLK